MKEMENRRQLALQRKAEEEKAKALDEERKLKEETERRKKERDDLTDKRTIKASTSKRVSFEYFVNYMLFMCISGGRSC